ncbi:MAG: flagellar biosynthesis anti-sigma factor FlgM [Syntrophales bacterium]|nr:flagellar biosynthesis anti-sigma factor FlgM [Syntrophales bacterium]
MKIGDYKEIVPDAVQRYHKNESVAGASEKKEQVGAYPLPEERVSLSDRAKEFNEMKKLIESQPEVRDDLVKKMREKIESGEYKVPAEDLARKIVGENLIDIFA